MKARTGEGRMADVNADQITYWNEAAGPTWAAEQARLDRQLEPLGLAAMDALTLTLGDRVLDIGCGCGQTSALLGEHVGPAGQVLGIDVSEPMLAVARARTTSGTVGYLAADAETHAFEPGRFDAAFSRFGVMFFGDPAAAFANIRRALKPGGKLAFVCWRTFDENLWMGAPMAAAAPLLPPQPRPDPLAPGPFAFADPDRVRAILTAAGFRSVALEPQDKPIGCGDLDDSVGLALCVGPLGTALRENPERRGAVEAAVRAALTPHQTPNGVRLPSATWIVTARM